jgi:hypothetical protein
MLLLVSALFARVVLAAEPQPLLGVWSEDAKLGYFEVKGTFDGKVVVSFVCVRDAKLCFESLASVTNDRIAIKSTLWDIDRWDSGFLISRDELPACQTNQLQVDFKAKSLVVFSQPKKVNENQADTCKGTKAEARELKYAHLTSEK